MHVWFLSKPKLCGAQNGSHGEHSKDKEDLRERNAIEEILEVKKKRYSWQNSICENVNKYWKQRLK